MIADLSAKLGIVFAEYGNDGIALEILSFGHLVGIVIGLGTILYLDGGFFLSVVRNSWDGYRTFMSGTLFRIATKYVTVGLAILWLTGCGFLAYYAMFDPEKLANPKLHAKLAFVSVLTVNGFVLHRFVFRRVAGMADCGEILNSRIGLVGLFCGAVSCASWIGAFLLGALPVLDNAVSFPIIVSAWVILVLLFFLSARVAIAFSVRRERMPAQLFAERAQSAPRP